MLFLKRNGRYIGAFLAGILWGGGIVFIFGVIFLRYSLVTEEKVPGTFDEVCSRLEGAITKNKSWTFRKEICALPVLNDSSRLVVFKLCNKNYAEQMLNPPESRKVAAVIPCSFAVYEKNGSTCIARMNVRLLGNLMGGIPGEVFPGKIAPEQKVMLDAARK